MLKLLSLNIEGVRHTKRILDLILIEAPDFISLIEAPLSILDTLFRHGYFATFAPMSYDNPVAPDETLGIIFASRLLPTTTTHYYTSKYKTPKEHNKHDPHSKSYPLISASLQIAGETYTIVTVHVYDTWDGKANEEQTASVSSLLTYLATLEPHILCGDFNMPRGYNSNYLEFVKSYTDTIPRSYQSSLDRTLHRAGNRTDLNAPIFDIYMVDYIFSQPPYIVRDVKLEFGFSDHAAIVATILKQ